MTGHGPKSGRRVRRGLAFAVLVVALVPTKHEVSASESWNSQVWNGFGWNSPSWNGTAWNSQVWNGAVWNSPTWNGAAWNSAVWNGAVVQKLALNGSRLVGEVGGKPVELGAGAVLRVPLERGGALELRIDTAAPDATKNAFADPALQSNTDIMLYAVSFKEPGATTFQPLCGPNEKALFLGGVWDTNGTGGWRASAEQFTITCTSGVLAKCARLGYKPWKSVPGKGGQQVALRDLHQACVRATRADYCGNGNSYTQNGTLIDIWDAYGFIVKVDEKQTHPAFSAEASFGTNGAGCIENSRYEERKPSCSTPGTLERFSQVASPGVADPDARIACAHRQDARGQRQLVFTDSSTYCPHSPTEKGAALRRDCSACTRTVCSAEKHCCGLDDRKPGAWDDACVARARSLCK